MDTFTIIQRIIQEQLGVPMAEIQSGSNLVEDLDADSLDVVELVMCIEEEFGITIDDDEAEKIQTVQQAVDLVDRLKGGE